MAGLDGDRRFQKLHTRWWNHYLAILSPSGHDIRQRRYEKLRVFAVLGRWMVVWLTNPRNIPHAFKLEEGQKSLEPFHVLPESRGFLTLPE